MSLNHKLNKRRDSLQDPELDFKSFLEPCRTPTSCKSTIPPRRKPASCDFSKTVSSKFPKSYNKHPDILNKTQALAKQTEKIRHIVDKKKSDCKTLFKTHAIQLNKEELLRIYKNDSCPIIHESINHELQNVKKLILGILEMNDNTYLRSIRGVISEVFDKFLKINVEIEAKVATIAEKYENQIKDLEAKCERLELRYSVQEKKVIDSLIEKNLQLSGKIIELENILKAPESNQKVQLEFDILNNSKLAVCAFEDEFRLVSTQNSIGDKNELNQAPRTPELCLGMNCLIFENIT